VEVGKGSLLIVHRGEGEMSFTGYWTRFAEVEEVLVHAGEGECEVVLQKEGDRVVIATVR